MTARAEMTAAGLRILDLLTAPEAAARLTRDGCGRYSADTVHRLAAEGELARVVSGALVRIAPESVAAYEQRQAAGADLTTKGHAS